MVLQMVRNECVRFGGHVDIEISYKILQLEALKEASILNKCFTLFLAWVVLRMI
jgi:hypothetical protein